MKTKMTIKLPEPKLPPAVELTRKGKEVVITSVLDRYVVSALAMTQSKEKPEETVYFVLLKHRQRRWKSDESRYRLFVGKSDMLREAEVESSSTTKDRIILDYHLYGFGGTLTIPQGKRLQKGVLGDNEHSSHDGPLTVVGLADAAIETETTT
jgi:hypothetical protein